MKEKDKVKFIPNCIFCHHKCPKYREVGGNWKKRETKNFKPGNWALVSKAAEEKGDEKLLTRIRGFDLAAFGALYHQSFRNGYIVKPARGRSQCLELRKKQETMKSVHQNAVNSVITVTPKQITQRGGIMKLSELRDFIWKT